MLIVGYVINSVYTQPCAKFPAFVTHHECRPVFIFTLSYLTFEKISSVIDGTRIRGAFTSLESFGKTDYLQDYLLFKIINQILNIFYVYTILKHLRDSAYFISVTRLQSRFTGWVCSRYVPVFLRFPFYGSFSRMYGVKIQEAIRPFSEYTTFTDFFTRTLKPGMR